jgi:hypothetical protein
MPRKTIEQEQAQTDIPVYFIIRSIENKMEAGATKQERVP